MNYLAHFYLARHSDDLIIGNFLADFIKGNKLEQFNEGIAKGIRMHREIDTFTDNHPVVYRTKERLFDKYHKYAAVVVDIYYDHILALNWKKYADKNLDQFAAEIYQLLATKENLLPERAKITLQYMAKHDWLTNYIHQAGIEYTFKGLSRRTKFNSGMENSHLELERDKAMISEEFELFFPELIDFISHYHE